MNRRPSACKADALPTELQPRTGARVVRSARGRRRRARGQMVGLDRIELSTSPLSGVRSSHLSYRPSRGAPARGTDTSASPQPAGRRPPQKTLPHQLGGTLGNRCTEEVARGAGFSFGVVLLRKEVIQPQVPLRLPCYHFTPITSHTVGAYLP